MSFHVISKTTGAKQSVTTSGAKPASSICQTLADDYFTELERWQARREKARRLNARPGNVIDLCAVRLVRKGVR